MVILEYIDTPILVEPSMLFCKHGKKICRHYNEVHKICYLKDRHIQWEKGHKAPYWCPRKIDALFISED